MGGVKQPCGVPVFNLVKVGDHLPMGTESDLLESAESSCIGVYSVRGC